VQNAVPDVALRSLGDRYQTYVDEVRRLVDAGFAVMRRTESLDPRVSEIVREAGQSNQAFYRHFRGKDELLLAILDDGRRQLVDYLAHQMAKEETAEGRVRRWVEGVLAQASEPAAAATRPFVLNSLRLRDRFPEESRQSDESIKQPLRDAIAAIPGTDPDRDTEAVHHLAMGRMHDFLIRRQIPTRRDISHVVEFALAGLRREGSD
jgi:AcrR family transcriptional regulator